MKRKILAFMIAVSVMLTAFPIFGYAEESGQKNNTNLAFLQGLMMDSDPETVTIRPSNQRAALLAENAAESEPVDWSICIYLCGTDLESRSGAATNDLLEMLAADIPENVRVMIMTGGTKDWDPYGAQGSIDGYIAPSEEVTQLYEIDDEKMVHIKDYESNLDMGKAATAARFLEDCLDYAPAKRMMVSFWNHGGGPFGGVSFDENTNDSLSLQELNSVLGALKTARGGNNTELLGFDACLMNTMKIGCMLADACDYMIASEEIEPGAGWDYRWLSALNEEYTDDDEITTLEAKELGCEIIDTYAYTADEGGDWSNIKGETLALVDLSQMDALKAAFNEMAYEMNLLVSDDERFAKISRTAEKVQHMYESYGILDLYDFANDIYAVLPNDVPAAKSVLDVLGESPGTEPEHFVGAVGGENPAVVYRGTGLEHNECLGLGFYYPTIKTEVGTGSKETAEKYVGFYRDFEISDFYTAYLMSAMVHSDKLREFTGTMEVAFDEESSHYVMQIENPDDALALKSVNYLNVFTDMPPGEEEKNYLLGMTPVEADWDNAKFTEQFDGMWYTLNGELFGLDIEPLDEYWEKFSIPIVADGEDSLSLMTAYHRLTDPYPELYVYIDSVTSATYNEDGSSGAPRTYRPEGNFTFRTLLPEYDLESHQIKDYHLSDEAVTVPVDAETGLHQLGGMMSLMPLSSGPTALYTGYFETTDMRGNVTLSEPCQYVLLSDFEEQLSVEEIPPQVYTGEPLTPKVRLLFMGEELLTEGEHYKAEYKDNTERGWATVTITSLMEELPGTLTVQFEIKDAYGIAEDRIMALLDDHLPGECESEEEYLSHRYFTEQAKLAYERLSGSERSKVSGAAKTKLNTQYAATMESASITAEDGNVEVIGVLDNLDWSAYADGFAKAWLYAKQEEPGGAPEQEALKKAEAAAKASDTSAARIACYNTKFLAQAGTGEPDRVEVNENHNVMMKIKLGSRVKPETLQVYRIVYGEGEPQKMEVSIITEGSDNYAVFETDALGYLVLYADSKPSGGSGGGGGSVTTRYTITFETNGGSKIDSVRVNRNSSITKPAEPAKDGYIFEGWFTDKECTKAFDFDTKATKSFTLYAKWTEDKNEPTEPTNPINPTVPTEPEKWKNPFADVKENDWFYDNVRYALENGLFGGMSETIFAPNEAITRGMLVTALWRMEEKPVVNYLMKFDDIVGNAYYAEAVRWTASEGIVNGYSDTEFAPDKKITREEIAAILGRYAEYKNVDTSVSGDLAQFTDQAQIADWARDNVAWAVGYGMLCGKGDGILDPQGNTTRAEAAAMLQRFLEKQVKQ